MKLNSLAEKEVEMSQTLGVLEHECLILFDTILEKEEENKNNVDKIEVMRKEL